MIPPLGPLPIFIFTWRNLLLKITMKKSLAVVAAASIALGLAVPASHAASQTIQVYISADTNIQDLWVKTLVPAFKVAYPGYDVNVTFDLHGDHDAQ